MCALENKSSLSRFDQSRHGTARRPCWLQQMHVILATDAFDVPHTSYCRCLVPSQLLLQRRSIKANRSSLCICCKRIIAMWQAEGDGGVHPELTLNWLLMQCRVTGHQQTCRASAAVGLPIKINKTNSKFQRLAGVELNFYFYYYSCGGSAAERRIRRIRIMSSVLQNPHGNKKRRIL